MRTSLFWLLVTSFFAPPITFGFGLSLQRIPLDHGAATVDRPDTGELTFLGFGDHSYEPARITGATGGAVVVASRERQIIAPFQSLWQRTWTLPAAATTQSSVAWRLEKPLVRDAFWDQILRLDPVGPESLPRYRLVETGSFGAALSEPVRALDQPESVQRSQQQSLRDPILPETLSQEMPWSQLEAAAYPLDFQKVLIASPHDSSPGFVYQNGQWLTTWFSADTRQGAKEDQWFAPALLLGDTLVRPAPLSARTTFWKTKQGRTLPAWTLEWSHQGITVRQQLFSWRIAPEAIPRVFVQFEVVNAPRGTQLALGLGRRPNVHTWDDRTRERTPIPFFTLAPNYRQDGNQIRDAWNRVVLTSTQPFVLEPLGPVEQLVRFALDESGQVRVETPQAGTESPDPTPDARSYEASRTAFVTHWTRQLERGAQVHLPSSEWMERIDTWLAQIEAITRVHYQKRERLSYGAYFYQYYFGIEEGWPPMALAVWGRDEEAKRQAALMLEPENRDKKNVHHQSRNGVAPTVAGVVARFTRDASWLDSLAPALIECADWTVRVRHDGADTRSPVTRGLLPPHIYGGDVRDPATSLYATVACWRGLVETAAAFRLVGTPGRIEQAASLDREAALLRTRLCEVMAAVVDRGTQPPFLPLALELPSLQGKHEGPYDHLTATRLGNYWNLFAPSFLELRFGQGTGTDRPDDWVAQFAESHGGLWAGLPRFYAGLDAAYAIGYVGYRLDRAALHLSERPRALAALESYFLHAASRNGHTIPEVAGLFPYRLERKAYERLVRESPWNFGMYDANRYLEGHISFTEPLGSGAGSGLMMIRQALVAETRNHLGLPDGGLILFPSVPEAWLNEGNEIILRDFPTAYGILSVSVRSRLTSAQEVTMECDFKPWPGEAKPRSFRARFAPAGKAAVELTFDPGEQGVHRIRF
ncbi:MAG: hypothetical protein U1F61_28475 [Opitutaceae bacterium]